VKAVLATSLIFASCYNKSLNFGQSYTTVSSSYVYKHRKCI